ncbi:MAG: nitrous oxide reductase accessory protein NosL [Chloroflexota bacterium]
MKRHHVVFFTALLILVLASCGSAGQSDGPPQIRYGEDVCDQCNMIISEPRFAAAYYTEGSETRRFDDIGEMFLYARDSGDAVRSYWVHDFHSESWLEADGATFVHDPDLATPMGWGIAAFSEADEAQAYGEQHGDVLTFSELEERVLSGELMPEGMARHDH